MCFALTLLLCATNTRAQQGKNFTPVEGADLAARMEAAVRQGRTSSPQSRFWTAYSFDVRPGVLVDFEYISEDGSRSYITGVNDSATGVSIDSQSVRAETRNLGVFLLRSRESGDISRIEVYNLERKHEYGGYPVYWLGRAGNEESINLLRGLAESARSGEIGADATKAIALHDDRRVGDVLESLARTSTVEGVRIQAVSWLGRTPNTTPARQSFLLDLARSERESQEIRRRAVAAFGQTRDAATLAALQNLYSSLFQQDLKRAVLSSVSRNESREATSFLIKVAASDQDPEMRKKALAHLGQRAGEQSATTIAGTIEQTDAETEIQKQAVVALSRRPREEAVPLLLKIARTHAKPEVRRQALLMLARTGDERALELYREILLK
jgi:HEAT repeat protein